MEYLSGLLTRLDKSVDFYHHPKCHRIGLKHILFADDHILFSSGRCSSILAIKEVVEQFLRASGLAINLEKSQVFTAGMPTSKTMWVEEVLGTSVAKLPVRYLGIPLSSKKISSADVNNLINRITSKINAWSNRFLSRAGRRLLIRSVLHATFYYWARMISLPSKVLQVVYSLCARFLWRGNVAGGKCSFLVSWKEVCKNKKEGGWG
ncbi:hypothetical protein QQ045_011214 [Rhodiola kirilowii]